MLAVRKASRILHSMRLKVTNESQDATAEEIAQLVKPRQGRPPRTYWGGTPRMYRGYPMFYAEAHTGWTVTPEDWKDAEPGNPKKCAGVCAKRRVDHIPKDIEIVIYPTRAKLPIPFHGTSKKWAYLEYMPAPETRKVLLSWDKGNPQLDQHLDFLPLSKSARHDSRDLAKISERKPKSKKKVRHGKRPSRPRGGIYDDRHAMPVT